MKILIIRLSALGDIILTSPFQKLARNFFPNAEIHFLCKPQNSFLVQSSPYLDRVLHFEGVAKTRKLLQEEAYDLVFDLQHSLKTILLTYSLAGENYRVDKQNITKWLMVNLKLKLKVPHIVNRYNDLLQPFGKVDTTLKLEYFFPKQIEESTNSIHADIPIDFEVFVLSATHNTKRLTKAKVIEYLNQIKSPIVLLGGPAEVEFSESILKELPLERKQSIISLVGKIDFHSSALLVKKAKRVFTNDTGLMHVAAAFSKPMVTFWGNTTPSFGMFPYNTPYAAVQNDALSCRPCSKIGGKNCPKGTYECLTSPAVEPLFWPDEV